MVTIPEDEKKNLKMIMDRPVMSKPYLITTEDALKITNEVKNALLQKATFRITCKFYVHKS